MILFPREQGGQVYSNKMDNVYRNKMFQIATLSPISEESKNRETPKRKRRTSFQQQDVPNRNSEPNFRGIKEQGNTQLQLADTNSLIPRKEH